MKISKRTIFKNGNRTLAFDTFKSGQLKGEVQVFNRECTSAGQFRVLYLLRFSFFPVADHAIVLCLLVLSFSFSLLQRRFNYLFLTSREQFV